MRRDSSAYAERLQLDDFLTSSAGGDYVPEDSVTTPGPYHQHPHHNQHQQSPLAEKPKEQTGGVFGGYITLLTSAIGVGILSFPFAFRSAGILGNLLLAIVFTALNSYTLWLLARYSQRHGPHLGSHCTFEALVKRVLGRPAYAVVVTSILVSTVGTLTAFLIVVGDLGHTVLSEWLQHHDNVPDFLYSKAFIIFIFCLLVALPLSLIPNLEHLSFSSFLAVATVFLVAGMVIARGIQACVEAQGPQPIVQALKHNMFAHDQRFFLAVPLVVFSLGCHVTVVPVYYSLRKDKKQWMSPIVFATMATCIVIYLITGLMGYLRFGSKTDGDILRNFAPDDIMMDVGKVAMAAHISLAYPVGLYPSTKAVQLLLSFLPIPFFKTLTSTRWKSFVSHWIISLCMVGTTAGLAILLPKVEVVFGLIGSTTAVALNFVAPALMPIVAPLSLPHADDILTPSSEASDGDTDYDKNVYDIDDEDAAKALVRRPTQINYASDDESARHTNGGSMRHLAASSKVISNRSRHRAMVERTFAVLTILAALAIAVCGTTVNVWKIAQPDMAEEESEW